MTSSSSPDASCTGTAGTVPNLDDITVSLFYQLRQKSHAYDFDILQCPKCPERLEALELDLFEENGQTYQRIWWTCRGIRNQSCDFPLWVPRQVFWTRRTEEQMKSGYIPLPNIHLLPQRLWYLYPTIFRDQLRSKGVIQDKKDTSGLVTPSSGQATRGSSVRPESVLATEAENEECNQESFRSTPVPFTEKSASVPKEMEIWESEVPLRQIRIDEEDTDDNFESFASNWKGNELKNVSSSSSMQTEVVLSRTTSDANESQESNQNPEFTIVTEPLPDSTDSFVHFRSQSDENLQQKPCPEPVDSLDIVVPETPPPSTRTTIAHGNGNQDTAGKVDSAAGATSAPTPEVPKKRSRKSIFNEEPDNSQDRIALVVPAKPILNPESENLLKAFQKQRESTVESDVAVISSLLYEITQQVSLRIDLNELKRKAESRSVKLPVERCTETAHLYPSPSSILSLEEAKKSFGDLTLQEYLTGVSSLKKIPTVTHRSRNSNKQPLWSRSSNVRRRQQQRRKIDGNYHEKIENIINIRTECATNLEMKPPPSKRYSSDDFDESDSRPALPKNLPVDEKCIAAVEMALKQSINGGIKGPEETSPPPRAVILKGSPSKFRRDMISSELFDRRNWRRPVHFGGHTNLDAFVTAYNLRYNRAEYLDALGSELCRHKIMNFIPSIPVRQQRLFRRQQQQQQLGGEDDKLDLETVKKSVDPNTLRLQIAHRLGIGELDNLVPTTKSNSLEENEINTSQMQHIGCAPLTVLPPNTGDSSVNNEYTKYHDERVHQPTSVASESLYSFGVSISEFDHEIKAENDRELRATAAYVPSFDDPEVDALVHRKLKNYAEHENVADESAAVVSYPSTSQQLQQTSSHIEASTSRIEYADFESAFEEYEDDNDVQHLDPIFDTHFEHHSL